MKCPFCRQGDFAVIDSRSQDGGFPRRRRACDHCKRKVWTLEQIVETPLKVVKKDETREAFDAEKIRRGLEKACYKRPIRTEQINAIVDAVQNEVYLTHFEEVSAKFLGDLVMDHLKDLDQVAYVRFASVYRDFKDVSEFVQEVQPMLRRGKNGSPRKRN
ncbi:MAG: transcriptional regulator NrdR [Gemmataceae bacterium]